MVAARVRSLAEQARRAAASERSLRQMERSDSGAVRTLARALRTAATGRFDDRAREWFGRVEALRRTLDASTDPVEVVDHGAGLPASQRTSEQMDRGAAHVSVVGRISSTASVAPPHGRLLYAIVDAFGARRAVELGTCLGISAAYQAGAMTRTAGAELVTCEGSPALAALAERNLAGLGLTCYRVVSGRFADTLPGLLDDVPPLDYAFVDGHHDAQATVNYFELLLPNLAPTAVAVFDDIRWSAGMSRAWDAIRTTTGVTAAVDARRLGIVVVDRNAPAGTPPQFVFTLRSPLHRLRAQG